MQIQEEQILVENRNYKFLFEIDYLSDTFMINVYDKKLGKNILEECELSDISYSKYLYDLINKPAGHTFKHHGMKYLIRNHDEVAEHNTVSYDEISTDSIYDTRNNNNRLTKIPLYLKEAWLKI